MGYVDAEAVRAARQAEIRAQQDEQRAERVADMADLAERGRGLFKDSRLAWLDDRVRVDLNRERGHVGPHELARAQAQAREWAKPILAESPGLPLEAFKEVVNGTMRPKISDHSVAAREEMLVNTRTPVYETRADRKATLGAVNADLAKQAPVLNAVLKNTGAGNSVPLARMLLEEASQRKDAELRAASVAKPWTKPLPSPGVAILNPRNLSAKR